MSKFDNAIYFQRSDVKFLEWRGVSGGGALYGLERRGSSSGGRE